LSDISLPNLVRPNEQEKKIIEIGLYWNAYTGRFIPWLTDILPWLSRGGETGGTSNNPNATIDLER
jgi:hypothetical protein